MGLALDPGMDAPPTWKAKLLAATLSTLVALLAAEFVAAELRDHAFPFLNIYEADAELGVRLEADTETATRSRDGRVTTIATNAQGFRGPDWTPATSDAPVDRRVMIVGDSQMLGYGVDWSDSITPNLQARLGLDWEVLPAAAPTWGPPEYIKVLERLVPTYRPKVVVFVANAANDWFETHVPNVRRTTERDGWAARVLHADPTGNPSWFPFRRSIMGKSHLVYAVRQLFKQGAKGPPPAVAVSAKRLVSRLDELRRPFRGHRSRITPFLLQARDLCARHGCRVVTAFLPMDVQVHPAEWTKYRGEKPVNVRPTWVLGAAYLADARAAGIPAVDWMAPLRKASPGAFLPDDYHMSPAGHSTCAESLSRVVRGAALAPNPDPSTTLARR